MVKQPALRIIDGNIIISPSATKLGSPALQRVAVCASHGGVYAAWLALKDGVRGLILNDAGIGLNRAGIAGLDLCDSCGVAAATVSHLSCRIGDAEHMFSAGVISHSNQLASELGIGAGMNCEDAAAKLTQAPVSTMPVPVIKESRSVQHKERSRSVVKIDSASLVSPDDDGQIVVCGSHGGLVGGLAHMAIQADVFAAAYNDAGVGIDDAGLTRLPALNERGIAGLTVAHSSAEIGNAESMMQTGRISFFNDVAQRLGITRNEPLQDVVARWRQM